VQALDASTDQPVADARVLLATAEGALCLLRTTGAGPAVLPEPQLVTDVVVVSSGYVGGHREVTASHSCLDEAPTRLQLTLGASKPEVVLHTPLVRVQGRVTGAHEMLEEPLVVRAYRDPSCLPAFIALVEGPFNEPVLPDGFFAFPALPPGTWKFHAVAGDPPHPVSETVKVVLEASETVRRMAIEVGAGRSSISGRVSTTVGFRLWEPRVWAIGKGDNRAVWTDVAPDGTFAVDRLPPGVWSLSVFDDAGGFTERYEDLATVHIRENGETHNADLDVASAPYLLLIGGAGNTCDRYSANATITRPGESEVVVTTSSDCHGWVQVRLPESGLYDVT